MDIEVKMYRKYWEDLYVNSRTEGFGDEVKKRISSRTCTFTKVQVLKLHTFKKLQS